MSDDKRRAERDRLFGIPASRPEWQQRQNDARVKELEKTRALRAARLAAQQEAQSRPAAAAPARKPVRVRRAS